MQAAGVCCSGPFAPAGSAPAVGAQPTPAPLRRCKPAPVQLACRSLAEHRQHSSRQRRTLQAAHCTGAPAGSGAPEPPADSGSARSDSGSAADGPAQPSTPAAAEAGSSVSSNRLSSSGQELPPELQGLRLNDSGYLIDERTGAPINDFGATRFDVAVRAIRGEFDPPPSVQNTEQAPGLILDSLTKWPADYTFQVVAKGIQDRSRFVEELRGQVSRALQTDVPEDAVAVKERLGGKYLSISLTARVRAAPLVARVFDELAQDERIVMKF